MTETILKNTTVASVRGLSPDEWRFCDEHFYVGRSLYIRSGKHEGLRWPNSSFGNPYKVERHFTRNERVDRKTPTDHDDCLGLQ